jgi:hypothetical protein
VIFNDIYRMISPVRFRAIKLDKKCKHLLNFSALTVRHFASVQEVNFKGNKV